MRAILRRLRRVEQDLGLQPTEQDRRSAEMAELLRERQRRRLEAQGLPFEEHPLPAEYQGRRLGVAETLRLKREQRLQLRARQETHE